MRSIRDSRTLWLEHIKIVLCSFEKLLVIAKIFTCLFWKLVERLEMLKQQLQYDKTRWISYRVGLLSGAGKFLT